MTQKVGLKLALNEHFYGSKANIPISKNQARHLAIEMEWAITFSSHFVQHLNLLCTQCVTKKRQNETNSVFECFIILR